MSNQKLTNGVSENGNNSDQPEEKAEDDVKEDTNGDSSVAS